jgi:hypothetical protein
MSGVVWLTVAAMAMFLVLLVPANYLLGRLMTNKSGSPTQSSMVITAASTTNSAIIALVPNSAIIALVPGKPALLHLHSLSTSGANLIPNLPQAPSTTSNCGFDQLAAA